MCPVTRIIREYRVIVSLLLLCTAVMTNAFILYRVYDDDHGPFAKVRYAPKRSHIIVYPEECRGSEGARFVFLDEEKKIPLVFLFIYFVFYFFFCCVARLFAFVGSICRSVGQMIDCQGVSSTAPHPLDHRQIQLKRQPFTTATRRTFDLHPDGFWTKKLSRNTVKTDFP